MNGNPPVSGTVRVAASVAATLVVFALLAAAALPAALAALLTGTSTGTGVSTAARADIPPRYLTLYQQAAATCPGLGWAVPAAIGKLESDHGRSTEPGVTAGENAKGARGPMQFQAATFAVYARPLPPGGVDPPSPYDAPDAVYAAVRKLCHDATSSTNGAPEDAATPGVVASDAGLRAALYAYNHSDDYVRAVLAQAALYATGPSSATTAGNGYPSERATVADPSGTGGHVTPRTATLYRSLAALGAIREGATCWDPHLQNPDSDHPRGKACDVFFRPHDSADVARGWDTARRLVAQHAAFGVHYLIWQGLIWSVEHPTWATYHSPIYGCPNPHNLTGCHFDHIHISLY